MSRGRGHDQFRLARTSILDVLNSNLRNSTYPSTPGRNELYDYYPESSNVRSSDNLLRESAHDTEESSKSINPVQNTGRLTSSRLSNVSLSSALSNLQNYGSSEQSSLHSQGWGLDFLKNIEKNKKASQTSSGGDNSADSYKMSPESRYYGEKPSISTLPENVKTVEEEDEWIYGDSNSMPEEIPKSVKKAPDNEDAKNEWSEEEDLFQESPQKKSNPEAGRNMSVWNIRTKGTTPNSPQGKLQTQNVPLGHMMGSDAKEPLKSSSIEQQKTKLFSSNSTQEKNFVSDDMRVAAGSVNKSKYHAAAQLLKKQSRNLLNEYPDSSHHDDFEKEEKSFRNDADEDKLVFKNRIPTEDPKDFKCSKIPEKIVRQIPKTISQKNIQGTKNYIKGSDRKRVYSSENYEQELKYPRYNSPRDSSPSRYSPYDSSRLRSPVDDYKYRPSSYPMPKPHQSDYKYRLPPYHPQHKSPPRESERHSYEFSPRHERRRYSRSPPRRSRERSPGYYKYKEKIPLKRLRERSRSPEYYRYKEKSPMRRSRERSRSPGYYKARDSSLERQYRKKSYKSYETVHKGPSESHPKRRKKKGDSSGDSFCSLSFDSDSYSSDNSSNSYSGKEKSRSKKNITKDSKTHSAKVEESSETKDVDKHMSSKDFAQSLEQICNFKDKVSEVPEVVDNLPKLFNKEEEEKLLNIVKIFENSQILSELVEGVQDSASNLASSLSPMIDTSQNLTLPVQNPAIINMPFPNSYPVASLQPNVPVHYPTSQVPNFPPLAFRPPVVMQQPSPPPLTSMLAPFPQTLQQSTLVEVPRVPEMKQMAKKRPQTLRTINLQKGNENTLSSPQKQIETKEVKASKDVTVNQNQEEKAISELLEAHAESVEKYKKLKAERHLVRIKVNSSVGDLVDMRKIMDETWAKKKSASDAVIHSKCKSILSKSQDDLSNHVKEAKRLEDELNRLRGKMPRELQAEISNIKTESVKEVSNMFYSGFDNGSHSCFLCFQQFSNISSILEHFQSEEHKEQMNIQDKEWQNNFNKHTELEEGKKLSLKQVQGVEFLKPLTGFYCTICSHTLFDNSSAESHLKSHDHFINFYDYISKHPLYERKNLLKQFVMLSKKNRLKEIKKKEEQLVNRQKLEAVEEKVKEMIKDQVKKEKSVDELAEKDDKAIVSNNQNPGGIKLTLTGENEKAKEDSKEKDNKEKAASKPAQKIYIGKAPNFKARPKPWYKRDIYQKNESASDASPPSVSKESVPTDVPFPDKKPSQIDSKTKAFVKPDQSTISQIDSKTKTLGKFDQFAKKAVESTCLTEEASGKLPAVCIDPSKEKLPVTKDPVVNQAIKNILLGTDSLMHKDIPLSEIKLPEFPVKPAMDSSANPTSQEESHNPLPMEIEEPPETFAPPLPPPQKLTTEEEKDFYILGINREDFRPLVVPVPPPSSLMNPNFYKTVPPPTVVCNTKAVPPPTLVCDTSVPPPTLVCDTSVPPPNFNINIAQPISVPPPPLSVSAHLTNALNSKQQSPDFKLVKNNPNLITIVPTNTLKPTDSSTKSVNTNVDVSPVKPTVSFAKSVSKNVKATPVKPADSPIKIMSKKVDAPPVKRTDLPAKIVSKKVDTPIKSTGLSKENKSSHSLNKNLEDKSSKVCSKSNENSSSGIGEMSKEQNSSQSSKTSLETSKPDLSEIENIKCDTSVKLSDSVDNLSQSKSLTETENKCDTIGKVKDSNANSEVSVVSKERNKSSNVVQNEKQVKSEACEITSEVLKSGLSNNEDIDPSDVKKNNLSQLKIMKKIGTKLGKKSKKESITKCEVREDNTNIVSETVTERNNTLVEKNVGATSKGNLMLDGDSSSCMIGEMVDKEQSISESCETDLETSKPDVSKVENVIQSDTVSNSAVPDDILSDSENFMEVEDENSDTSEKDESLIGDGLNISSNEIQDNSDYNISSNEIQDNSDSKISFVSVEENSSSSIAEIQTEGQAASIKFKNISETSVSSKIEEDTNCEERTPTNVSADNLDQSESAMEVDIEDVNIISGKKTKSFKINPEDSTNSINDSISSSIEEQIMEQNVPETCETVLEALKSDALSVNSTKTESIIESDVEGMISISDHTCKTIKKESVGDSSSKNLNDVPIEVCVNDDEKSCNSDVKSAVEEESVFKASENVPESCEASSSEIESTSNSVNTNISSAPITEFSVSTSSMEVDDDNTNVVSAKGDESIEKCTMQDSNEAESVTCKESDDEADCFVAIDDAVCKTEKQFESETIDSKEAQSCMDPNPCETLELQVFENSSEEKSDMEVSSSAADSIQIGDENSTELNQNVSSEQPLDEDSLDREALNIEPVSESNADEDEKYIERNEDSVSAQSLQEESCNDKSVMEICSSTIQELIDLKEAQQASQELDLETDNVISSPTQSHEESTEIKMSLCTPESVVPENETSKDISGNTREVSHQESSTEVIVENQDAENKVSKNQDKKTSSPDNLDETETLSKSDTDTEEYEDEE